MTDDLLLRDGLVFDGTGAPGRRANVLVTGSTIAAVGAIEPPAGTREFDCRGLAVAPGFIDAHSHSDLQVLEDRPEKARQGVTAEVVGNCGFSAYPLGDHAGEVRSFADGILCGGGAWGWRDAREYLAAAASAPRVSVASLVGHGTLRIAVAGDRLGPLTAREMEAMEGVLAECLEQGACGFSTGLMYAPGSSAPREELERLCRVVARHGKLYTTHMRDYAARLPAAVDEQLDLARAAGCRLQISHLQAVGQKNWPLQQQALDRIETAAARDGVDVMFDCYPYTAGSTVLTQILPEWALDGGLSGLLARLASTAARQRIASEIEDARPWQWNDVYISAVASEANAGCVGRNLQQIAETRGLPAADAVLALLEEDRGKVNMLCFNQSDDNLRQTLSHPLSIVISDGFYVRGRPHPRLHGTFPRLLGQVTREWKWMPLETAIHKITGQPARRFGFSGRGLLEAGRRADLVVFDPGTIDSPATYESPEQAPVGVTAVVRGGMVVAEKT